MKNRALKNGSTWKQMKKYRFLYLMILPIAAYFIVFNYYPLFLGIYNSFHEVKLIGDSAFVGMQNYQNTIKDYYYQNALGNTLVVNFGTFILQFVWGLVIALLANELRHKLSRSAIQTVTYLPNLLSWSVVGGIWISSLSPTGMINGFLKLFLGDNFTPITFMAETAWARPIFIFTGAWKGAGYTAVLFLAAIVSIDQSIYEAASIDGATRFQQMMRITVPNLFSTMKVVVVLAMMGILRNFDQLFVMYNSATMDKVRNLVFLIYQNGIQQFKIGLATAAATLVLIGTLIISMITRRLTRYDESYD